MHGFTIGGKDSMRKKFFDFRHQIAGIGEMAVSLARGKELLFFFQR